MTDVTGPEKAMVPGAPAPGKAAQRKREEYFTASQGQLIWARFKKQRAAMVAAVILGLMILLGLFAPFFSPYDPTIAGADRNYRSGAPQIPMFCDQNGCSWRPFLHAIEQKRNMKTLRMETTVNTEKRLYVRFFVDGWEYRLGRIEIDLPGEWFDVNIPGFRLTTHLFGLEGGGSIHLFGTDSTGKDIFSRTLHSIYTSLSVGMIGVLIAFVLALVIGGIAGYFGGWIDSALQMLTDAIRTVPAIPLFMALAAFVPDTWSAESRFFFISCILGLIGWPTLARRVRTHLLSERTQDYVLAAQLCGASSGHVIRRHLLPSFTSYIIVDLVISFPYMVLSETALSFIGLGLKEPVNSLGVLLQNVSRADVLLNYQWEFIPVIFFVVLVLAFVFVGDGLRDAADPYSNKR